MMWVQLGVNFVIFCVFATQTNAAHEPPSGVPSFIRSSVESVPGPLNDVSDKLKFSINPTFGSMFLPLRSAVESAPITPISSEKSFIRDSVEYRPAEPESKPTHDEFRAEPQEKLTDKTTQLSGKYSAFYVPTTYDTKNPQPFRFGSPYQQIVDISSVNQISNEILKKYNQEILSEQSSKLRVKMVRDSVASDYKVLCYITNWSFYRVPEGKFVPENIDTKLCTHIIYSFASLDPESLMIREFDPWADIENNMYKRATSLDIPVLLAIGGWTDSTGNKYSRLISDENNRKTFASNTANFLKRHGFSGLHFDWNYPKCWQSDCRKGPASDKPNFTKLMRDLRQEFKKSNLLLGVAISGYKEVITEAYELSRLSDDVDFLTVMTYDYHGGWESETGHVSPLYGRPGDKYPQYNTDYTMQLLVKEGAAREKLIMGVPFYGQSFILKDFHTNLVGEGTPSRGPGNAGEITRQPGMLAYYEICKLIRKQKWSNGRDGSGKSGPYATLRNQWVGYEDPESVAVKAKYVVNSGFGGIAAWTLDLDDFSNKCCNEAFPLLKSVNRIFGRLSTAQPFGEDCTPPPQPVTPVPVEMTTFVEGGAIHDHTTWPSWNPTGGSMTTSQTTTLPTTQSSTESTLAWWQSSSEQSSTWWQTTISPSTWWSTAPTEPSTTTEIVPNIPAPVNVMPIIVNGEHCEIGEYRPHPSNCNAYYRCVYGQLRELNCAGGLHWNQRDMLCDWPAAAMCLPMSDELMEEASETAPTTAAPTTTTTRRTTTRRTTTRRSTTPRTTISTTPRTTRSTTPRTTRSTTPRTTRSTTSRTTRSTTSRTTRSTTSRTTRSTTSRTTRCTTPRTTRSTTPRTTRSTTPKTTTPGRTTVSTMSDSETCMSGEYYPHSDCGSFYICVNGMLIPQECGPDLQWNQNELTCDHKSNVRCVSTERYLRLVKKPKASLDDPCEGDTHVPYPGSCHQFLLCLHGHLYGGECGDGLHWSTQYHTCDWPSNAHCHEEEDGTDYLSEEVDSDDEDLSANEIIPTKRPTTTTTTTIRTTTKPSTPRPQIEPHSGHYKLVCYFTNWAWYRKGVGKYTPDDIDTDLCTHIVYGFAVLDYSELTIRTHDSWADIDNRFYERVAKLKEKGVTVSLALGGWNDSQGDKYSRLVRSPAARKKFVKQALNFVEKYGFGGLDLDWEYPVCWQTECKKGFPDEKEGFTELVKDLSVEFRPRGLVLSTAVSPSKQIVDAGYDVPTLSEYFDWIAVMTYDYHGQWDKKTGHVAPLYYHPDDDISYFNTNFSIHYWMEKGAPPRKLVMGMPLYGQSFTLADTKNNGLNSRAPGPGQAGESTRAAGFLAYYEICDRVRNRGWQVVQDPEGRMGPYAYKDNQWVSYDDKNTLRRKSQLIRSLGLGGGMVWALDLDDFRNRCDEGYHPLLSEIQRVLRDPPRDVEPDPSLHGSGEIVDSSVEKLSENPVDSSVTPQAANNNEVENPAEESPIEESPDEETPNEETPDEETPNEETPDQETPDEAIPEDEVIPDDESVSEGETAPEDEVIEENLEGLDETSHESIIESHPSEIETNGIQPTTQLTNNYKVICYFTNWAWYRQSGGKYVPEDIDTDLCTHIVYGFAVLDRDNLVIKPHDSWADLDNKFYERVTKLRAKGIKVSVAIGGWNDSAGDKYSRLVRDPAARARFIKHVVEFIERNGFDGLDLDWEYPVCWQVDCSKGYADEKENFAALAQELREEFTPRGWLLSTAVSPSKKVIDAGYDIPIMSDTFDWIAVMAYDYHGQWDKQTGHVAPMYQHPDDVEPTFNANFSINYWIANGADPQKLVMGMPMYGQSFSLAENKVHNLNSPTYGGGEAGDATRARGFLSYYEICERIKYKGWQVVRDRKGRMGPYAYLRDQWVSFDDAYMIRHKSEFVKAMRLGGAMIWALDLDDFRNVCECEEYPLLRTINRVLRDYPGPHPRCKLEMSESEIATESPNSVAMTLADIPQTSTRRPASSMRPDVTRPDVTRPQRPSKPTRPVIQQDTEMEIISCNNRLFSEHSNDCNKYYQCQFGIMMEHSCPPGLHWNVDHCDWPQNANCHLTGGSQSVNRPVNRPTTHRPTTTTHTSIIEKPIDVIPTIHDDPNGFKVVCYFTNWAWYRPGDGKYTPDDIDESLCTHIVYGFAVLDRETMSIRTHDSWADIDNRFYERVVALRAKGVHVTLALGGWNDSLGDKYSNLVRSASNRARFVKQAIEFIEKYRFEGLDLDWEYPVCWQVDCTKGFADEKEGFASLVRELSEQFKPRGWLLSAAVSPSKMVIDAGYDVPTLAQYFDWIAVMTYDFHGNWDKQTGHLAPLYYYPGDTYDYFNSNFSINYWIQKGAPSRKLVMGVPLYGQSFSLADSSKRGLNEKSYGPGEAGEFTRAGGFLSYYEICQRINAGGWNVVRDPAGRIGPYASKGSQWVSYDDVAEVRRKTNFMKDMNLGGGMVWALDLDDFRGVCGCGKHPLLRTLSQDLRQLPGQRANDCT